MRAHDADRRVRVLPNQTPGLRESVGLSKAEVDRAAWAITSDGPRLAGAAAANRILQELPRWRVLAYFYNVSFIRLMEDWVYAWVAAHRDWFSRWGTTPECAQPGVACVPEGE